MKEIQWLELGSSKNSRR